MSDFRIKDGSGTGSVVKVEGQRLWTKGVASSTLANIANTTGYSFSYGVFDKTLPGTDEYLVFRFKNTDSSREFHLHRLMLSYNGGSTNHDRTIRAGFYVGTYPPSANYTSVTPNSTNFGKSLTSPSECQAWDGVGNGMTTVTNGLFAFSNYFEKGFTDIILDGTIIVPFGQSIGITVKPEEIGVFCFLMSGWFDYPE